MWIASCGSGWRRNLRFRLCFRPRCSLPTKGSAGFSAGAAWSARSSPLPPIPAGCWLLFLPAIETVGFGASASFGSLPAGSFLGRSEWIGFSAGEAVLPHFAPIPPLPAGSRRYRCMESCLKQTRIIISPRIPQESLKNPSRIHQESIKNPSRIHQESIKNPRRNLGKRTHFQRNTIRNQPFPRK